MRFTRVVAAGVLATSLLAARPAAAGVKVSLTIGDNEYDNLFIVVGPVAGEPTLIRLRY